MRMGFAKKNPYDDLYFLLILSTILSCSITAFATISEASALLKWKSTLKNQTRSSKLSSWVNNTSFCTNWYGVSCNSRGSIIRLNLTDTSIEGTFQDFPFSYLPNLAYIDLSMNRFFGTIPPRFGNLSKLIYFDLSINQLTGAIPPELGNLRNLKTLNLFENKLNDSIPSQLSSLESLYKLDLSHNNLSGFIPTSFEGMKALIYINISNNNLDGPLPNTPAFENATADALEGNIGLCSNIPKQRLKPCPITSGGFKKSKKNEDLVVWILVPILGALVILSICACTFTYYLRKQKSQIGNNSDSETGENLSIFRYDGKVKYQEIIKSTKEFDPRYLIGVGKYGKVYKAKLPYKIVAVKRLHEEISKSVVKQEFLNEVKALTEIRHRNVVKLFGFCSQNHQIFLVYEYMEMGSLNKVLANDEKAKRLDWTKRINILKGVAYALSYMHHERSTPIIHCNISSRNILLDKSYKAKISDFGTAKLLKMDSSNLTEKCDVYSFGVLILEVVKGKYPEDLVSTLSTSSARNISLKNISDERLQEPKMEIKEKLLKLVELALSCLQADPQSRPTMLSISTTFS